MHKTRASECMNERVPGSAAELGLPARLRAARCDSHGVSFSLSRRGPASSPRAPSACSWAPLRHPPLPRRGGWEQVCSNSARTGPAAAGSRGKRGCFSLTAVEELPQATEVGAAMSNPQPHIVVAALPCTAHSVQSCTRDTKDSEQHVKMGQQLNSPFWEVLRHQ